MVHAQPEETAADVVREARKAKFRVTQTQLRDWRQGGFIRPPRRRWLGRGQGSVSLYPAGTADQVIALCKQLATKRSLIDAGWALWWDGYSVSEERVRDLFCRQVEYVEAMRAACSETFDPEDFDDDSGLMAVLDKSERVRLLHPVVSGARRRTGKNRFSTLLNIILHMASGISPELEDDDAEILSKGFGLVDSGGLETLLDSIAQILDPEQLDRALREATLSDLAQARDELRAVLDLVDGLSALVGLVMAGKRGLPLLETLKRPRRREGSHMVLVWLSLRRSGRARQLYGAALAALRGVADGTLTPTEAFGDDSAPENFDPTREDLSNE